MHKNRLNYLDGLRGVAALCVVLYHLTSAVYPAFIPDQQKDAFWISYTPIAVLWNGTFAVSIFFVLSGFVLANATLRKADPIWIDIIIRYMRLAVPAALSSLWACMLLKRFPNQANRALRRHAQPLAALDISGRHPVSCPCRL